MRVSQLCDRCPQCCRPYVRTRARNAKEESWHKDLQSQMISMITAKMLTDICIWFDKNGVQSRPKNQSTRRSDTLPSETPTFSERLYPSFQALKSSSRSAQKSDAIKHPEHLTFLFGECLHTKIATRHHTPTKPTRSHFSFHSIIFVEAPLQTLYHNSLHNNRLKSAMMAITSSSSSLYLIPSHQLPAASSSSDMDISPSIIHGPTTPAQGMASITHIALQSQTEMELTSKRMRCAREVRFDTKISGRRIVSYTDEVRRDIYYNVSHLGDIPQKLCT